MRVGAEVVGIENDEAEATVIEGAVAPLQAQTFRDARLLRVEHVEVVIAEDLMPAVTTRHKRPHDFVEAAPLTVDQIPQVDTERQVGSIEVLHRGSQLTDRGAVKPSALVGHVGVLRVRHQPDGEQLARRTARDERRRHGRAEKSPPGIRALVHGWRRAGSQPLKRIHASQSRGHSAVGPSAGAMPEPCGPRG